MLLLSTYSVQSKVPSVKSVISKASGATVDLYVEPGDKVLGSELVVPPSELQGLLSEDAMLLPIPRV